MAFQKGHDPRRNTAGRPKGAFKKLSKTEMELLNDLLGKATKEAVDVIFSVMRDTTAAAKDRVGAAKYVISTKIQVDQVLDRRNSGEDDDEDDTPQQNTVVNLVWENKFDE